jgi:hypothetical protein
MVITAHHIAHPERLRDRVVVALRPLSLDTALADGTPSEAHGALALRARRLTSLPRRRELALAIQRLLREADRPGGRSRLRVRPLPDRVAAASRELASLADKLGQSTAVSARGVAQALILLTDGTGPLYNPHSDSTVGDRAASAAANLTPGP